MNQKELDKGKDIKYITQDRKMKRKQMNKQNIKKTEDLTDKLENHIREPKESYFPELGYLEEADYVVTEDNR